MKTCSKCGIEQPLTNYHKSKECSDGHIGVCKACRSQQMKGWYSKTNYNSSTTRRAYKLKTKYGITIDTYNYMMVMQSDRCAICLTDDKGDRYDFWCVDHDHTTGKVRGLLCHPCNTALGKFQDDQLILSAAVEYLR